MVFDGFPKLNVPSTVNIRRKLFTPILGRSKIIRLVSGRLAYTSSKTQNTGQYSILDFNPELQLSLEYIFIQKNLQSERYNTWFKPWLNVLLQSQSIIYAGRWIQWFELWIYNFADFQNSTAGNSHSFFVKILQNM